MYRYRAFRDDHSSRMHIHWVPSWGAQRHLVCLQATYRSGRARTAVFCLTCQPSPTITSVPSHLHHVGSDAELKVGGSAGWLEVLPSICPLACSSSLSLNILYYPTLSQIMDMSLRVWGSRRPCNHFTDLLQTCYLCPPYTCGLSLPVTSWILSTF